MNNIIVYQLAMTTIVTLINREGEREREREREENSLIRKSRRIIDENNTVDSRREEPYHPHHCHTEGKYRSIWCTVATGLATFTISFQTCTSTES
jgi:hypothetical protein